MLEHDDIRHIKEVTCENASKHIYVVVEMYGGGGVNVGEVDIGVSYRLSGSHISILLFVTCENLFLVSVSKYGYDAKCLRKYSVQ